MKSARASFAALALNDYIYVYGGIAGVEGTHNPKLADPLIEQYNILENKWTALMINNAPQIASFGWTKLSEGRIAIFGGSNGDLLTEDLWIIDFCKKTAEEKDVHHGTCIAQSKLAYKKSNDSLYQFAGYGSSGENYTLKLSENEWVRSEKSHSLLQGQIDLELQFNESIYYPAYEVE
jgi:hypothetical protein